MKAINYREWNDLGGSEQEDAVQFYMNYHVKLAVFCPEYFNLHDTELAQVIEDEHQVATHESEEEFIDLYILSNEMIKGKLLAISTAKAMAAIYEPEFIKYDIVTQEQLREVRGS